MSEFFILKQALVPKMDNVTYYETTYLKNGQSWLDAKELLLYLAWQEVEHML